MANSPGSSFSEFDSTRSGKVPIGQNTPLTALSEYSVEELIKALEVDNLRETALRLLSKRRHKPSNFAMLLWFSFRTPWIILQEITNTYHCLTPQMLTMDNTNRVCNAIALFQFMATDPLTRPPFLRAQMVFYLFPFLRMMNTEKPFEYLRLSSLGVVGALLKSEDPEVIPSLLELEAFPLFLRCLESGGPLSKTVASYIIQKILMDELGLHYCCNFAERFYSISRVLGKMLERIVEEMVKRIAEETSMKLLKIIVRCFLRMSECTRARDALTICLPPSIKDATITNVLNDDPATLGLVQQIIFNVAKAQQLRAQQALESSVRSLQI